MVILFISLFCSSCGQRLELEAEYHPKGYSYYVKRQSYRFPERTVFEIITDGCVAAEIDWTGYHQDMPEGFMNFTPDTLFFEGRYGEVAIQRFNDSIAVAVVEVPPLYESNKWFYSAPSKPDSIIGTDYYWGIQLKCEDEGYRWRVRPYQTVESEIRLNDDNISRNICVLNSKECTDWRIRAAYY